DGRGYLGGKGYHERGRTLGNVDGASNGAGGSYGGTAVGYEGRTSNSPYGEETNPTDPGSGGGAWEGVDGGDGGGRIFINAGSIALDGAITANGAQSGGSASGSGSGGTVNIHTGTLTGSGVIKANGGTNECPGSGGRIAIIHTGNMTLPQENVTTSGAVGAYGSSSAGTVYIDQ
ncbi:MAG TPA: hypothetical protein VHO84_12860, partial [Syntrophorhabdaceae bacterium]|nr:hypothetical protein [Syntrophorhabdaceae bacterium]